MEGKEKIYTERRRHPRVEMIHSVGGEVQAVVASSIINLSISGTLVELPCRLNPGGLYEIQMSFTDRTIKTVAQVVRSYVHSVGHTEDGTSTLLYRAGLLFQKLEDDDRAFLVTFVNENLSPEGDQDILQP
jgi:hypothetical protein